MANDLEGYREAVNRGPLDKLLPAIIGMAGEVVKAIGEGKLTLNPQYSHISQGDKAWEFRFASYNGWSVVNSDGQVVIAAHESQDVKDLAQADEDVARLIGYALISYLRDAGFQI